MITSGITRIEAHHTPREFSFKMMFIALTLLAVITANAYLYISPEIGGSADPILSAGDALKSVVGWL